MLLDPNIKNDVNIKKTTYIWFSNSNNQWIEISGISGILKKLRIIYWGDLATDRSYYDYNVAHTIYISSDDSNTKQISIRNSSWQYILSPLFIKNKIKIWFDKVNAGSVALVFNIQFYF